MKILSTAELPLPGVHVIQFGRFRFCLHSKISNRQMLLWAGRARLVSFEGLVKREPYGETECRDIG
eukprot:1534908-Rhodomonas_salina.2